MQRIGEASQTAPYRSDKRMSSTTAIHNATAVHALAIVNQWFDAFTGGDVEQLVGLFATDALFFGTGSKALAQGRQAIRTYFERVVLTHRLRDAVSSPLSTLTLSDNVVIVTGLDRLSSPLATLPFKAEGRLTFVVAKRKTT